MRSFRISRPPVCRPRVETHPAAGRLKLNLASMQASLAFVDLRSGDLLARHVLPHDVHQLAISHVMFDAHRQVWFGCQYEGPAADHPPLVGCAGLDREPVLVSAPEDVQFGLANYVGAMAVSRDGEVIAALPDAARREFEADLAFDNHVAAIPGAGGA